MHFEPHGGPVGGWCAIDRKESTETRSTLGGEQLTKCFARLPVPAVAAKRCRVGVDEPHQDLSHDRATNRTKTMTSCTDIGFAENVVPERSLALPPHRGDPNLLGIQRGDSNVTGHGLASREPDTLSTVQVTDGERMIVLDLALTGHTYWQLNECSHQLPVDFLRPLRRCHTWCVEEQCPVDRPFIGYRAE